MKALEIDPIHIVQLKPRINGVKLGRINAIREGCVFVDYDGNPFGPLPARTGVSLTTEVLSESWERGFDVVLIFAEQDPAQPIVADVIRCAAAEPAPAVPVTDVCPGKPAAPPEPLRRVGECVGEIRQARVLRLEEGIACIQFVDAPEAECHARSTVPLRNLSDPVLAVMLAHEEAVIVGQLYPAVPMDLESTEHAEVAIRGEKVTIEAASELLLVAGNCRLQLDARGKAVTVADQVVSRARGANKIQGGSVQIN